MTVHDTQAFPKWKRAAQLPVAEKEAALFVPVAPLLKIDIFGGEKHHLYEIRLHPSFVFSIFVPHNRKRGEFRSLFFSGIHFSIYKIQKSRYTKNIKRYLLFTAFEGVFRE